ncbi:hypothetical protein Desaci_4069 [Desulfosporosinus acidiphilus SJ4]|uniref:Uncharacterized protein n=1 Tax=Desulfosporosinus acidiphilus (strain DSM 22704 / JCM 16185 / SJ4) TaxID=646529 RepID=I4DAV8_DESAJ|nr:hypothetical protein [Desulfosporosinus acidiphilus]AFM42932.1 hypothetical protein Desaci_4069 [Desulfosporosinus acidiphilus SJ4]
MTTKELNSKLQIVHVKGKRFKCPEGYRKIESGFAFFVPGLGYLAFNDSKYIPYMPLGGRKALESILKAGGMLNYDDIIFIREMDAYGTSL